MLRGTHTFLPSVIQDTSTPFTDDLRYAAGFLERDETGYNVHADDRPSNTVTLFKQAHKKSVSPLTAFLVLQTSTCIMYNSLEIVQA